MKDHSNVSDNNMENWEYFDDMDAILGMRLTSSPIALVHSAADDISQYPAAP